MTALVWDTTGNRKFESGIDKTVLYPVSGDGVSWNGIISITENISGGEASAVYLDGVKYLDLNANEDFQATLVAFGAPPEFQSNDGNLTVVPGLIYTKQPRSSFGLCYRSQLGNDIEGSLLGYKLHLVYNITASPTSRDYKTQDDNGDPETYSWELNTVPPASGGLFKPTAHVVVDSTLVNPIKLGNLENVLYGITGSARLPTQSEVFGLLL